MNEKEMMMKRKKKKKNGAERSGSLTGSEMDSPGSTYAIIGSGGKGADYLCSSLRLPESVLRFFPILFLGSAVR